MKRGFSIICIAAILVLLPMWAGGQGTTDINATRPTGQSGVTIVTGEYVNTNTNTNGLGDKIIPQLEFKDTPIMDAIKMLSHAAQVSYAIVGELPTYARITADLKNISARAAFDLAAKSAGLNCVYYEPLNVFIISAPPTATVGGVQVPIMGATSSNDIANLRAEMRRALAAASGRAEGIPAGISDMTDQELLAWLMQRPTPPPRFPGQLAEGGPTGMPGMMSSPHPNFPMSDKLVDLEVKDAPLAEAIAKLSKDSGVDMVVDKAVPEGIKVSAKIYKMQLSEVLSLLTGQANLTYSVGYHEDKYVPVDQAKIALAEGRMKEGLGDNIEVLEAKRTGQRLPIIYIVPLPELSVSTPGATQGGVSRTSGGSRRSGSSSGRGISSGSGSSMGGAYGGVRAK